MWSRQFGFGACATTAAVMLLAMSIARAQPPSQTSEKSATGSETNDLFQAAVDKTAGELSSKAGAKASGGKAEPEFVRKTDQEWAKLLNPAVYMVTRRKATEPPFSGRYATGHFQGTFLCACCEADLFSARTKFDSGTGWPSFWQPVSEKALVSAVDNSEPAEPRVEVMCRRCGAHLGHVFNDGPAPTGLRFCINSLAIQLKPTDGAAAKLAAGKAKARARTKTKSRATMKTRPKTASGLGQSPSTSKTTDPAPRDDPPAEKSSDAKPSPEN